MILLSRLRQKRRDREVSVLEEPANGRRPLELSAVVEEPDDEPRPRLSPFRVITAAALLGGASYGGFAGLQAKLAAPLSLPSRTWFAPYVDVTLTPTYQFQNLSQDPARQSVLGFVVAASPHACRPSWGGVFNPSQANEAIALTTRIAQLRGDGASVVVSFGGKANTSLAVACPTAAALERAYQSIIDAYGLHTIDLDVEGATLDSFAVDRRRARAVRLLEQSAARAHRKLSVWLTLPVEPSGLQANALSVVRSTLRERARLAGVNVMAMDFAHPPGRGVSMLDLVERSLDGTASQLARLLPRYGIHMRQSEIWQHLGVTVMIGQNDLAGQRFTLADARGLRSFAKAKDLARLSMWSINRDQPCGASFDVAVLSNTCSGVPESNLSFTRILDRLTGMLDTSTSSAVAVLRPRVPDTNPADAPFPQWNPGASYVAGYKVVEKGEIYQAKWYNSAQDPSAQYQYGWQSPWELLGPVLPSDHAPVIRFALPGTYPTWSAANYYIAGERVQRNGLAYQPEFRVRHERRGGDA